jgi:hypothetical protein
LVVKTHEEAKHLDRIYIGNIMLFPFVCRVSAIFNYVPECGGSGNACADL